MKTLDEVLNNNLTGLYYGNRVLLPFAGYILKVIVDDKIVMDFSPSSDEIFIKETGQYTEIYFKQYSNLKEAIHKYETIKLIVVEKDKDVFNFKDHRKLDLRLGEKHKLIIETTDEDILFIE